MKLYTTNIKAIDPSDGIMKSWCGPDVPAISFEDARYYCDNNGLGYCEITGILSMIGEFQPDGSILWVDYDNDLN